MASYRDIFIINDEVQRKHILEGAVGADQIEDGAVGTNQIANNAVNLNKVSPDVRNLLLPNINTYFALANSFAPDANNPFVTRAEILSFTSTWKDPVQSVTDLPNTGNNDNDIRLVASERVLYTWQNNTWIPINGSSSSTTTNTTTITRDIDLVSATFSLVKNASYDIEHKADAEFNRTVQVKEKILGTTPIYETIELDSNDLFSSSLYSLDNTVISITTKQVLPGNVNIIWNPGIVGLIVEDINQFNYRVESITVQNQNNFPLLVTLDRNIQSSYTGNMYIGNIGINGNYLGLVRQFNNNEYSLFTGTSRSNVEIKKIQVLGSNISGVTAVITKGSDGSLTFHYTHNECEPVWSNYQLNVSAESFHCVHILTYEDPTNLTDSDLTDNISNINRNDMYALAYTDKLTRKPLFSVWSHNFGNPKFLGTIKLDASNTNWTSYLYEDIHLDIKELKYWETTWNNVDSTRKIPDVKYVVAITASIIESDNLTDRIAVWLNDDAGHDLTQNWGNNINPVKTETGFYAQAPKIIISPGNFATGEITEDVSDVDPGGINSLAYRLWVFYRDYSDSLIKGFPIITPPGLDSRAGDFNFIAGIQGRYPGDNGSPNPPTANKLGVNSRKQTLFYDPDINFSCDSKYDFDVALWEGEFESGLIYKDLDSDNEIKALFKGTPVIIASNASNEYEILVQYKTKEYSVTDLSKVQRTNRYGRNLKLKVETQYSRNIDHGEFGAIKVITNEANVPTLVGVGGYSNADHLHIFYSNTDSNTNLNVPYHIHNKYGTWINESPIDSEYQFIHRQRQFSDPIQYLGFENFNEFSFDLDSHGRVEFCAFNNSQDTSNRGLYYARQDWKCKFAIWGSELGEQISGPGPRAGFTYFHYDNYAYIQGGYGADGTVDSSMWRYNATINSWEVIATTNAPQRVFHLSEVIKNVAYSGKLPNQEIYGDYTPSIPSENLPIKPNTNYIPPGQEDPINLGILASINDMFPPVDGTGTGFWMKIGDFGGNCTTANVELTHLIYTGFGGVYTAGEVITGNTSGAVGKILGTVITVSTSNTGTLIVRTISGTFINGEGILKNGVNSGTIIAAPSYVTRRMSFFNYSDSDESNSTIQSYYDYADSENLTNQAKSTEGYRDSIIGYEVYNLTSGSHAKIVGLSSPSETCGSNSAVFLILENISGGSRSTYLQNDQIVISYPNRPPFDQIVMYGGGTSESSRTNGYPDDLIANPTTPPDTVQVSGTGNIGDNQALRDTRTIFVANITRTNCTELRFNLAPTAQNGASFAPTPCITGALVFTDYSKDDIGGICSFPNFVLFNRTNAFRYKFTFEQDTRVIGSPFSFVGRWSQLDPLNANSGEPLAGITGWRGAKIYHYGGLKPAPIGHSDYPYVESPGIVYFGGSSRSDFQGIYMNSLVMINAHDIRLGWSVINPSDSNVPSERAGCGLMVVNPKIENPIIDGLDYIQYHKINDLDQEIWIFGGNNGSLENVNYNQAKTLDDTWKGSLQYTKRSFNIGELRVPSYFTTTDVSSEAIVAIKFNSGLNGYIVPNGLRTSNNILNSNKKWRANAEINFSTAIFTPAFVVGEIIEGQTTGCKAEIVEISGNILTISNIIPGPQNIGYPEGHPNGKLFYYNSATPSMSEKILVNGVERATVDSEIYNITPQKHDNDRYTELSINDPTDTDYNLYGPNSVGSPDWISEIKYDPTDGTLVPDRDDTLTNQGSYWPLNIPPLGERRWTILTQLTITIPSGPGSGNWDFYVGVYNNGIYSYVEYFFPSQTEFALNLSFIEFSGGQYNEDASDTNGKSWFDVGSGTLFLKIRNIVQQPFGQNYLPYISSVNNTKFVEIVSVKWADLSNDIGIKPFKSTYGGFISDSKNYQNIINFGGRTHSNILTSSVFSWNRPSIFVQNEKTNAYTFAEINGKANEQWGQLKHGNIVKDISPVKVGEVFDYPVIKGEKYSAWGIAKITTDSPLSKLSIVDSVEDRRKHISYVGFTVTPNLQSSDHPGLGLIESEELDYFNVEFTGKLNYETGHFSIIPATQTSIEAQLDQFLFATNSSVDGEFGWAVDIDVNASNLTTAVISGLLEQYIYIYEKPSGGDWKLKYRLQGSTVSNGDNFGYSVAIDEDYIVVGAPNSTVGPNADQGKVYIFKRTAGVWAEEAVINSSGIAQGFFGWSVAIEDETIVVGAIGEGNTGKVHVVQNPPGWTITKTFDSGNITALSTDYQFGWSVSISGDRIAAGAPGDPGTLALTQSGTVRVLTASSSLDWTTFTQVRLQHTSPAAQDNFGKSVSINGTDLAVGATGRDLIYTNSGAAYVFTFDSAWTQQVELFQVDSLSTLNDQFGNSVDIKNGYLIVGSELAHGGSGAVYLFVRTGIVWSQQQIISGSLTNANHSGRFGNCVALDDDASIVITGAYIENSEALNAGSAYLFARSGVYWVEEQRFIQYRMAPDSLRFGKGITINEDRDIIAIGAYLEDYNSLTNSGRVYVYRKNNNKWYLEQVLVPSDAANSDQFGWQVRIWGNRIVVGAPGNGSGAVYVFLYNGSSWIQEAILGQSPYAPTPALSGIENFGYSVAIHKDTILIGVPSESTPGNNGRACLYQLVSGTWTFRRNFTAPTPEPGSRFGWNVSVYEETGANGSLAVIGHIQATTSALTNAGKAYVFEDVTAGGTWLSTPNVTELNLNDFSDNQANSGFGSQAIINLDRVDNVNAGNFIAIAADAKDEPNGRTDGGAVYIYKRVGSSIYTWDPYQKITPSDVSWAANDRFGSAVALDFNNNGSNLIIGSQGFSSSKGRVYVFKHNDMTSEWEELLFFTPDTISNNDRFGQYLQVSGNLLAVAADQDDFDNVIGNTANDENIGSVYIYDISDIETLLGENDLFEIVDINYHTYEAPIKSGINIENNEYIRVVGDKVGGEYSSRINSWVFSQDSLVDTSLISRIRDDRAISVTHTSSNTLPTNSTTNQTLVLSNIWDTRYEANTNFAIPQWMITEIFNYANTGSTNVALDTIYDFLVLDPNVRMVAKMSFIKNKTSFEDPDLRLIQYFFIVIDPLTGIPALSLAPLAAGNNMIIVRNGEIIDTNYDAVADSEGYNFIWAASVTGSMSPNIEYVINLREKTNTPGQAKLDLLNIRVEVDLLYLDSTPGRMDLPVDILEPVSSVQYQDTDTRILVSFDDKATWKKYDPNTDFWITSDPENIMTEGMSIDEFKGIISLDDSGWNNYRSATIKNIPSNYLGFVENSSQSLHILVGMNTNEPAHTPSLSSFRMNFYSGSYWEPKNFYESGTDGNPFDQALGTVQVQMLSPTITRIINRTLDNEIINREFKASVIFKRNI